MIYLLGGSGYVGQAYQALLARKGIPFRNIRRAEANYTDAEVLGRLLRDGRPEFLINAAGYKIWPAEVESLMFAHPAIQECCVIAAPDARRGESVKAIVVLKEGDVIPIFEG